MKAKAVLAVLLAMAAMPAAAQTELFSTNSTSTGYVTTQKFSDSRISAPNDNSMARDGCINQPGVAHSSADCTTIVWMDPNTVLPDKPLDQLSGAEENLIRSYNILVKGQRDGTPRPRVMNFPRR